MLQHRSGVLTAGDTEDLHQFRVALRKTRALIKLFRHTLPDVRRFADDFKWLAGATGPARDLDVLIGHVQAQVAAAPERLESAAPIAAKLKLQRSAAQTQLQQVVESPRASILMNRWRDWLATLPDSTEQPPLADVAAWTAIEVLILENSRRLLQAGVEIDASSPAAELHELRIRGKRLRYLLESFDLDAHQRRIGRLHRKLKDFQTLLGAHQDSIVAAEHWRQLAAALGGDASNPTATSALLEQWLSAEAKRQLEIRAELPRALRKLARSCSDL